MLISIIHGPRNRSSVRRWDGQGADEYRSRGESFFNKLQWQNAPFSQVTGRISDALGGPIDSRQSPPAKVALEVSFREVVDHEEAYIEFCNYPKQGVLRWAVQARSGFTQDSSLGNYRMNRSVCT